MSRKFGPTLAWFVMLPIVVALLSSFAATQTHVQTNAANVVSNTNALAFASANQAGDLIVAEVDWDAGTLFESINDSNGNVYIQIGSEQTTSFGKSRLYYAKYINAGANIVATRVSGAPGFHELYIHEYSGLDTASPFDSFSVSTAGGSAFSSGNLTTHFSNDLLYGIEIDSAASSASSGWTARSALDGDIAADMNAATTGNYAFTGTSSGGASVAWVAAFKAAVGGGGTTPTITSLSPTFGMVGASVTISGTNFGATQGMSTVTFNGTPAMPTSWSATSIAVTVPSGATTGSVVVTVGGVTSNGASFTVTGGSQPWNHVQTNSQYAADPVNALSFPSPNQAGDLIIAEVDWDSNSTFTSISDSRGNTYTQIGTEQSDSYLKSRLYYAKNINAGANTVTATVSGSPTVHELFIHEYSGLDTTTPLDSFSENTTSDTTFTSGNVTTNAANDLLYGIEIDSNVGTAGTGWIVRSTLDSNAVAERNAATPGSYAYTGTSSGEYIAWVAAFKGPAGNGGGTTPTISSISPSSGAVGTSVTINGSYFGTVQNGSTITFNGTLANVISWSENTIVTSVPCGATTGNLAATIAGVPTNGEGFTISATTPTVTSLSPNSGAVGTLVTISGTSLGLAQGACTLKFNGKTASVVSWSGTQVSAIAPGGVTTGLVNLTSGGTTGPGATFTVTAAPHISGISPNAGATGQTVTISGTGFGSSQTFGMVMFNGIAVTPASWTDTSIQIVVPVSATSGSVSVVVAGVTTNSVNFAVSPAITNIMPASGGPGSTITIMGHDFGTTQPTGASVTFNGVTATILSWATNAIVALVPSAATTGQVVVTAGGATTNGFSFTVTSAPVISTISTTSGIPGTQVTIDGSGFGTLQGQASVVLGSTYGIVTTWSDSEVVATVAPSAKSGSVQILRGGIGSNALTFTVPSPTITGVNPTSGAPGAQITISGTGFGATQGAGLVWVGTTYGVVSTWTDNQIICNIASSARSGTVKVQQNGVWSSTSPFTVNSSNSATVIVTPAMMNMYVGETRSIRAIDGNGNIVSGLSWTSSAPSIVSLSTDDPPTLTANAPGHVTITAGTGTADVFVAAGIPPDDPTPLFPPGTIRWSVPGNFSQIIPAAPSPQGVTDTFAIDASGNVQAVTSDGIVVWQTNVGAGTRVFADFQGGLIAVPDHKGGTSGIIQRIDGISGQLHGIYSFAHPCGSEYATFPNPNGPAYSVDVLCNNNGDLLTSTGCNPLCYSNEYPPIAIHPDGTVFTIDGDSVVGIDAPSGTVKFRVQLEHQVETSLSGTFERFPEIYRPIVAGDGFAYIPYHYDNTDYGNGVAHFERYFRILRVGSDGSANTITLAHYNGTETSGGDTESGGFLNYYASLDYTDHGNLSLRPSIITNRDQGILITWMEGKTGLEGTPQKNNIYHLTTLGSAITSDTTMDSGSLNVYQLPPMIPITPVLQKEDGTYIGTTTTRVSNSYGGDDGPATATNQDSLVSFNLSGNISVIASNTYTLFNPPEGYNYYHPALATADGGVIVKTVDGTVLSYNTNQAPSAVISDSTTQSWTGNVYQLGSLDSFGINPIGLAASFMAFAGGNPSGNGTAASNPPFAQLDSCFDDTLHPRPPCPGVREAIWNGEKDLIKKLSGPCAARAKTFVFDKIVQHDTHDNPVTVESFLHYLQSAQPQFYDGTRSKVPLSMTCQATTGSTHSVCVVNRYFTGSDTVADYFADHNNSDGVVEALTVGGNSPLIVFFRPDAIGLSHFGATVDNDALVWHEGLHGMTAASDNQLEQDLLNHQGVASVAIDEYMINNVFDVCGTN